MSNIVVHDGIVENKDETHLQVKIIQTSACAQCSVKGHCSSADNQEKLIDIYTCDSSSFLIGEKVRVVGEVSMGVRAILLAFVIPFFIVIASLFVAMAYTGNDELLSVAISFGLLALYYIVLALNRNKMKREFSFKVKHINS